MAERHVHRPARQVEVERRVRMPFERLMELVAALSPEDEQLTLGVLGERGLVELVGVVGYYTFVSMTLTAFDIGSDHLQPELLE